MIDGIPNRPKAIFTKRTCYWVSVWWGKWDSTHMDGFIQQPFSDDLWWDPIGGSTNGFLMMFLLGVQQWLSHTRTLQMAGEFMIWYSKSSPQIILGPWYDPEKKSGGVERPQIHTSAHAQLQHTTTPSTMYDTQLDSIVMIISFSWWTIDAATPTFKYGQRHHSLTLTSDMYHTSYLLIRS